ncbi:SDR family NAD(P)-dependent oxidoreductase [Embleya sp. NBC_00888]|uniref:SDR family NAD(P)-dependent oxidoreductase n=1 Tax=Embleya sp. NBC_00888 TaxID=2975960 RepID=UPI00386FE85C
MHHRYPTGLPALVGSPPAPASGYAHGPAHPSAFTQLRDSPLRPRRPARLPFPCGGTLPTFTPAGVSPTRASTLAGPRTVLVTGAASGIGYETARLLATAGMSVIVHARNGSRAEQTVDRLVHAIGVVTGMSLSPTRRPSMYGQPGRRPRLRPGPGSSTPGRHLHHGDRGAPSGPPGEKAIRGPDGGRPGHPVGPGPRLDRRRRTARPGRTRRRARLVAARAGLGHRP